MAQNERIAYSVAEFARAASIGRNRVYEEIAAGRLKRVKVGRRTLIPADAAHDWLKKLEADSEAA